MYMLMTVHVGYACSWMFTLKAVCMLKGVHVNGCMDGCTGLWMCVWMDGHLWEEHKEGHLVQKTTVTIALALSTLE